jgi:hypothetical protein
MAHVDDLSRCLTAFDQNTTLVVVVEMSEASWLVAGMVPGLDRQPLKKLEPSAPALLRLVERWRQRVAWRRKRQKWPHPLRLVRRRGRSPGVQGRAFG